MTFQTTTCFPLLTHVFAHVNTFMISRKLSSGRHTERAPYSKYHNPQNSYVHRHNKANTSHTFAHVAFRILLICFLDPYFSLRNILLFLFNHIELSALRYQAKHVLPLFVPNEWTHYTKSSSRAHCIASITSYKISSIVILTDGLFPTLLHIT